MVPAATTTNVRWWSTLSPRLAPSSAKSKASKIRPRSSRASSTSRRCELCEVVVGEVGLRRAGRDRQRVVGGDPRRSALSCACLSGRSAPASLWVLFDAVHKVRHVPHGSPTGAVIGGRGGVAAGVEAVRHRSDWRASRSAHIHCDVSGHRGHPDLRKRRFGCSSFRGSWLVVLVQVDGELAE